MKTKLIFISLALALIFSARANEALAAKSADPRITEVAGTAYTGGNPQRRSVRVHFQFLPVTNGQIIKVAYVLKTKKSSEANYKPPKKASRSGTVKSACSHNGSAVDLNNIIDNNATPSKKFLYSVKVRIKQPGKTWSRWSGNFSF